FMIGGDGELRKDFEHQVREAGMQEKIIFTGHLDDTTPYFNIFDIFCLPTLREGFGVVFAEAQACGVPVVASDIAALREVVCDGVTGKLVSVGDVDGFADALRSL
ncbi:MAG: glycosyltransferase family 4 protein, partial [Candidatus Omnitrophota bacterium]